MEKRVEILVIDDDVGLASNLEDMLEDVVEDVVQGEQEKDERDESVATSE